MKIFAKTVLKIFYFLFLSSLFFGTIFVFLTQIKTKNKKIFSEFEISAGVVPHHLLARELIENFFNYLSSKVKPEVIILLSPDHFQAGKILESDFITVSPLAEDFHGLKIDQKLISNISFENEFVFENSAIKKEHGILNLLPFIKNHFPDSKIVPILISQTTSKEKVDRLLESLNFHCPDKTLVLASVDFSHYLPKSAAEFHDTKSKRVLINFEKENFQNLDADSWQALYLARGFANLRKKESPTVIGYKNSADFLEKENTRETTSYFSVVFEKEGKNQEMKNFQGKTLLFVGDIMLDRGVEVLIRKNSVFYPFEKIKNFLRGIDIVVGNLEGPILKNPPHFPQDSLKFAFSSETLRALSFFNFNLLSLANNHTFDTGKKGLEETKELLSKEKINFVGHPINCKEDFLFEKEDLFFLAFNKTFPFNCSNEEIVDIIREIRQTNKNKFLIVIFHWGNEYQNKSSIFQQDLAHQVINAGADLIIGHHPHVVQEIEEYKGKLIFYSLGNFIFDQYFSKETQESLAVGLEIYPEKIIFRLFPIQSKLSQPFLMDKKEASEFLEKLAKKSDSDLFEQIRNGIIEIER